jgi:hypothetical protein
MQNGGIAPPFCDARQGWTEEPEALPCRIIVAVNDPGRETAYRPMPALQTRHFHYRPNQRACKQHTAFFKRAIE